MEDIDAQVQPQGWLLRKGAVTHLHRPNPLEFALQRNVCKIMSVYHVSYCNFQELNI